MTDTSVSSESKGNVLARDLHGTFYIVPIEAMLQYAVNDAETLTAVTRAWEAAEGGEDVEGYTLDDVWPWPDPWIVPVNPPVPY